MQFLARVYVKLKPSVLDPQGQAVIHALHEMNHTEVHDVRIGKYIEVRLEANQEADARANIKNYCEGLLANTVIETYDFTIEAV